MLLFKEFSRKFTLICITILPLFTKYNILKILLKTGQQERNLADLSVLLNTIDIFHQIASAFITWLTMLAHIVRKRVTFDFDKNMIMLRFAASQVVLGSGRSVRASPKYGVLDGQLFDNTRHIRVFEAGEYFARTLRRLQKSFVQPNFYVRQRPIRPLHFSVYSIRK